MTVPTYDQFIEPILRILATKPDGIHARDAHDEAAKILGLSESDKQELLPSGIQRVYKNRAGWAHDRLKRAGLSSSTRRGFWKLTEKGIDFVNSHPTPLSQKEVEQLAIGFMNVILRQPMEINTVHSSEYSQDHITTSALASPDDRLGDAISELRESVTTELIEVLLNVSPSFFETIVLDLLHRMGYGTSRHDLIHVGGVSDGGIDGVISLDKLGLEKVYVQAKRWQNVVGRPEIQGFYGALAGQRANKGVFITTSTFTSQAIEFAKSIERIVLVDGMKLAELMIDHEVGITSRTLKIPKIDSDYFDEESS